MKRKLALLCVASTVLGLLAGCGGPDVTKSTVELKKNGNIVEYTIEDFSESYYDAEELKAYIESEVEAYAASGDGTVKVKKSEVEEQTARLTMQYENAGVFADFSGLDCFSGSIVQAQAAGFDFDVDFQPVQTEKEQDAGSVIEAEIAPIVSKDEVLGDDELKVFIIRDHVDIIVPGTIEYVSADCTQVIGKNQVSLKTEEETEGHDVLVYVLYK